MAILIHTQLAGQFESNSPRMAALFQRNMRLPDGSVLIRDDDAIQYYGILGADISGQPYCPDFELQKRLAQSGFKQPGGCEFAHFMRPDHSTIQFIYDGHYQLKLGELPLLIHPMAHLSHNIDPVNLAALRVDTQSTIRFEPSAQTAFVEMLHQWRTDCQVISPLCDPALHKEAVEFHGATAEFSLDLTDCHDLVVDLLVAHLTSFGISYQPIQDIAFRW